MINNNCLNALKQRVSVDIVTWMQCVTCMCSVGLRKSRFLHILIGSNWRRWILRMVHSSKNRHQTALISSSFMGKRTTGFPIKSKRKEKKRQIEQHQTYSTFERLKHDNNNNNEMNHVNENQPEYAVRR